MKGKEFLSRLNELDSDLLVEAEEYKKEGAEVKRNSIFIKFASVAAIVAVLVAGVSISIFQSDKASDGKTENPLTSVEQEGAEELGERNIFFAAKPDGSGFTEEENAAISQLDGVKRTEYQGGACRINYFYREGVDYTVGGVTETSVWDGVHVKYSRENNHYVTTGSNLSLNDLSCGRLPEKINEVVLYSSDESILDKTLNMYFLSSDMGGYDTLEKEQIAVRKYGNLLNANEGVETDVFFGKEMTIVGILQEPTEQVYFSDSFCEIAAKSTTGLGVIEQHVYPFETTETGPLEIIKVVDGQVRLSGGIYDTAPWEDKEYADCIIYPKENACQNYFLYVDENLKGNEVSLGKDGLVYMPHTVNYPDQEFEDGEIVPQEFFDLQNRTGYYSILELGFYFPIEQLPQEVLDNGYQWYEDEGSVIKMRCKQRVERWINRETWIEQGECVVILNMMEENAMSGPLAMGVSEDLFHDIYDFDESLTIAVYMEDGQEELVKEQLAQMGYVEYHFPYDK